MSKVKLILKKRKELEEKLERKTGEKNWREKLERKTGEKN